ncbi:MAG: DUF4907 domain-containing protein [Smithella sp.]|nr:DUF4907 domain-containing protein [Smithella sp.]
MKNNKIVIPACLFISFILLTSAYAVHETSKNKQKQQNNPYADAEISVKIIPSFNNTFGYNIVVDGKILVHQPHIPALPGNEGFSSREKARKVAEFVTKKIRRNEMPPSVTLDDLNKMGVLQQRQTNTGQ